MGMDNQNSSQGPGPNHDLTGAARTRAWILLLGGPPALILVMILMLSVPGPLQRSFCPSGTLVASHLGGAGTVIGALIAGLTPLLAATLYLRAALSENRAGKAIISVFGVAITALGIGYWWVGLRNYYCATPTSIAVHRGGSAVRDYSWRDVTRIRSACLPGAKGGMSINVDLQFSDGSWIGLGGDSLSPLMKHYHEIGVLTRGATYDNALTEKCTSDWHTFFAHRPS